jgi:glycosyltransferase involved in cell wall biosynthesis
MEKKEKKKIVIIMPAYNAERTLEKTYRDIPKGLANKIILVDDDSHDETVKLAKKLGLKVFVHPTNLGYGGNQKTCYWEALKEKPDIVVMIHPDYQYDATLTGELIKPILDNRFDVMLGSRIRSRKEALEGGMPFYKYLSNRFLTILENIVLGLNLSEYHTGFRAFTSEVLRTLPFQRFSNDFVFDQEILISAAAAGFRIGEIPVPVRYFPEASTINFLRSARYGLMTLWTLLKYVSRSIGIKSKIFA